MTSTIVSTGSFLDRILERTAEDVLLRKSASARTELERRAGNRLPPVSLQSALSSPHLSVIAEFKRASPSRGRFPVAIEPAIVAAEYLAGGAAALSVLTDEPFFEGTLDDLAKAAEVAHRVERPAPLLRKDFIVDDFQILEAKAFGADAILLIVAALDQRALVDLLDYTRDVGLEALVEVHDDREMERAVAAEAALIGINNRDLRSFQVDLAVTERLAPLAPAGTVLVGESGIFTAEDAKRLAAAGINAVLVGESLIVASDRSRAVRLLAGAPVASRNG